jgi:hypothetical protein
MLIVYRTKQGSVEVAARTIPHTYHPYRAGGMCPTHYSLIPSTQQDRRGPDIQMGTDVRTRLVSRPN